MPTRFGKMLRQARLSRGLSQSELARMCGLKPSAISHFETGRREPCLSNFRLLKEKLQVTADSLLEESTA